MRAQWIHICSLRILQLSHTQIIDLCVKSLNAKSQSAKQALITGKQHKYLV